MRHQAHWSEFLCQFNLAVWYCLGKLGAKPNVLTRRWDVYPKEGDKDYACVNPDNYRPIFTNEQLTMSLRATYLEALMLWASVLVNIEQLQSDILSSLSNDPVASLLLSTESLDNPWWTINPKANDLQLCILWTFHDHPTAGHFGQNRTLELIRQEYTWPGIHTFVKDYVSSCTSCACSKTPRHRPFSLLKQLPVPEIPWILLSSFPLWRALQPS